MKLLVIGGTRFLGRWLVADALARGHEVTLFHRGITNPGVFPEVEHVLGDRTSDLDRLAGRKWDAAVDTCGFRPDVVAQAAELLSAAVAQYAFVSSLSVYADASTVGNDEDAPLASLSPGASWEEDASYGPLKALSEREVVARFREGAPVVRAGLLVGPHDYTDRLTYWVRRVAGGGELLAPAPPTSPLQLVDVRDVAAWLLDMLERGQGGTFNATGPAQPMSFGALLELIAAATGTAARVTWVDADFLLEHGVRPWTQLPLWLPGEGYRGFMAVSVDRALGAGLRFRDLRATVADVRRWDDERGQPEMRVGLSSVRERQLLQEAAPPL